MYKYCKISIFGVFLISIMLFLMACSPSGVTIDDTTYQINYLTDGGSTISPQTYAKGDTIILPDAPTKIGYTFLGWNQPIPEIMPDESLTFMARWQINTYTITFDMDGGIDIEPIDIIYGEAIRLNVNPSKVGYNFVAWNTELPEAMPANDITLKALWNAKTYTINFDTDGGSTLQPMSIAYESAINNIPSPTKIGHTFIGWDKPIPETMPNEDMTLKALWEVNDYTITFDTQGGGLIPSQTLAYNEPIDTPEDPVKDGYIFVGWDTYLPELMPAENITLHAVWQKVTVEGDETFTENFESLQSIKDSGQNSSEYLDYDYIGQSYVQWELVNARIDLGMKQGGNAITLGGFGNDYTEAGMGRIYAESIHDGISYLQFDARLPFSPKSTYPQGPGKDKAQNVLIKVFINDKFLQTLKFENDDVAHKGYRFKLDNLNIVGTYSLSIEVSSGHRLTLDNILWITNKNGEEQADPVTIDFESSSFDYDNTENIHVVSNIEFAFKEVHTNVMHPDKELNYMNSSNGLKVARFRGNSNHYLSTPTAYMYNVDYFSSISTLSFDARLFGSDSFFTYDSVINIYYQTSTNDDYILYETIDDLTPYFETYQIDMDLMDVRIKIEVLNGTVNFDNIIFNP